MYTYTYKWTYLYTQHSQLRSSILFICFTLMLSS